MTSKKNSSFEEESPQPDKKNNHFASLPFKVILIVVAAVGIGVGIYFYLQYEKAQQLLKNPKLSAQMEQQNLIEKVGKLIELPKDDQPTIATVSDVTKLQGQSFFAKAKNGYKVLIFPKNKKAILYDPVKNKLIEVGPVNLGEEPTKQTSAQDQEQQAPVKISLYNGTKIAGYASSIETQLKEKAPYVTVISKGNAKGDHKKTVIVDVTGKQKESSTQLAKILNGEVGPLPEGEVKPSSSSAEILVFLGKE